MNVHAASKAISAWTFGLLAGPVIGPLVGGYLIEYLNWRWIFFINLPIGLIAFFGLLYNLRDKEFDRTSRINYIAFILLSISVACLQLVLDRGEIVERGKHVDLLDKNGLYASLHKIQFPQQH